MSIKSKEFKYNSKIYMLLDYLSSNDVIFYIKILLAVIVLEVMLKKEEALVFIVMFINSILVITIFALYPLIKFL